MFSAVDAPYLTPSSGAVDATPWSRFVGEGTEILESPLASWSSGMDVRLSRVVEADLPKLLEEASLAPDAVLGVSVSWMSTATKIRRNVFLTTIGDRPVSVQATLSGDEIGGTIELLTSVILLKSARDSPPWVASDPGAVLLEEKISITLEGEGAVFPMAVMDFGRTSYHPEASWHVETTSDLDSRFSSTFQVLVNERDRKLVKAIEAEKPSREQIALLDELMSAVMQTVLELAYSLRVKGELSLEGHAEGTVGAVLAGFVEQTGDLHLDDFDDLSKISVRRSTFQGLARNIAAGRVFE